MKRETKKQSECRVTLRDYDYEKLIDMRDWLTYRQKTVKKTGSGIDEALCQTRQPSSVGRRVEHRGDLSGYEELSLG